MLIVISEKCGCEPFEEHEENPDCLINKREKELEKALEKLLEGFESALAQAESIEATK